MNNNQFRRLLGTPSSRDGSDSAAKKDATSSALGSKKSSFVPMTPRAVKGGSDTDFARQVRERNAALQPSKKFKTAVPKGVKYGAGYTDRARARAEGDAEDDEKASRIHALEEQMKLGQISKETFESLRDEITGGDISSTHLIKGLDRKLLERVRRGEDVLGVSGGNVDAASPPDVDEALEKFEEKDVEVVKREQVSKKGTMAPPQARIGVKRSRDELMAELKAQRKAAADAKAAPIFDSRWRKVGEEKSRIKIDHKGREVIITVDEDGTVKKKVRKVSGKEAEKEVLEMPDPSKPVLGSNAFVPVSEQPKEVEDDDDDIFEGIGTEYNPLGNDDEEDDDDDSGIDDEAEVHNAPPKDESSKERHASQEQARTPDTDDSEAPKTMPTAASRNYFNDAPSDEQKESAQDRMAGLQALLKKANKEETGSSTDPNVNVQIVDKEQEARLKKRAQMLAQEDRDFEDMDMGFGSSRYDDGEDEDEGKKVKLSEWTGSASAPIGDGQSGSKGDGGKKKRKPKKRKGDANSMGDIMKVIEGRKAK